MVLINLSMLLGSLVIYPKCRRGFLRIIKYQVLFCMANNETTEMSNTDSGATFCNVSITRCYII